MRAKREAGLSLDLLHQSRCVLLCRWHSRYASVPTSERAMVTLPPSQYALLLSPIIQSSLSTIRMSY